MKRAAPVLLLALAACGTQAPGVPCPDGACVHEQTTSYYETNPARLFDLLVVMDDSASMAAHQDAIVAQLAPELDKIPGGAPELRVRVIRSSLASPGLATFPGCACAEPSTCLPAGTYLEATQLCGHHSSFTGPLSQAFERATSLGAGGCGWEQPLAAARAVLEGDPQDGSRFLRKDAYLFVLIVTDEDDCSVRDGSSFGVAPAERDDPELAARCRAAGEAGGLVPVDEYVKFFRGLKGRPDQQVAVSVVAGWPPDGAAVTGPTVQPACQFGGSPVLPAPRLRAFAEAFEYSGVMMDLCTQASSIGYALGRIGERLAVKLSAPCLPSGLADRDPAIAGVQPSCAVTETMTDRQGQPLTERPIPSCDSGAPFPCWRAIEDFACESGFRAKVERNCQLVPGTIVAYRCETTPR